MDTFKSFASQLYEVNDRSFANIALELFRFQAVHNPVYKSFIEHLGVQAEKIHALEHVPFLPISFFKRHELKTGTWATGTEFTSSGTTGSVTSRHAIPDLRFYLDHSVRCFEHFFGSLSGYHFLGLLPSYLERSHSSLIAMLDHFNKQSGSPWSGFYLSDIPKLLKDLEKLRGDNRKTILWGVTYALLDLAETHRPDLSHCRIIETGGMKGRRREITRQELHEALTHGLNVDRIYSEYGMTELQSQAYSLGGETFRCPPWLKIMIRDLSDPFRKGLQNETGGINVIDLANWHSVAFIETEDIGRLYADGSFGVLGRMDNSDVRGCNLLVD